MKGINAFSSMSGVDDRFVMASLLPADIQEGAGATAKVRKQEKDNWFTRMTSSGWFAAAISLVVAFGVLAGIVAAGRMGTGNPSGSDPSQGIHGHQPYESGNTSDTSDGTIAPPLTENPEPQKGPVAIVSDGITVYPKGYCVYISEMRRNENGELIGMDGDGLGAVYQLGDIWDSLPTLQTSGNDFDLALPDNMTLRSVRVFEMVEVQTKTFEEIHSTVDGPNVSVDPMGYLSTLRGFYTVVLEVYHETNYSEDEYTKGVDEYAFKLDVDPNLDITFPVRMLIDGRTYYLEGKDGINSGHALTELASSVRTATVTRETDIDFYLAPQGNLQSVTAYDGSFRLMMTDPGLEPLVSLPAWAEGDYYFVFTVSFPFEGVSMTLEYPFHIKLVEKTAEETAEETYPNDVGETPEPPRVQVSTGWGNLYFGSKSLSSRYHEGYMLWVEMWDGEGLLSGDGFGATGQLSEIADSLPTIDHDVGSPVNIHLPYSQDTLTDVSVYDKQYKRVASGQDASVLTTLSRGSYIVVLTVVTQEDYIPEVEAYERTCTEYAFRLAAADNGSMKYPETNPRVVVSGGGQTAVFETEEDGFHAWSTFQLGPAISWMPREEGIPAADVIFNDDDAMCALPDMKIAYGDTLTVALDAAGDELWKVTLYDTEGGLVAEGNDLSLVNTLKNDGYGRRIIVILQVVGFVNEDEMACYEYPFILEVYNP